MKEKVVKSKNQNKNKSVSEDLLESVRNSLYRLKTYLDNIDFDDEEADIDKKATTVVNIIDKIGKSFITLDILEKKVKAEEAIGSKVRGGASIGLFEDE